MASKRTESKFEARISGTWWPGDDFTNQSLGYLEYAPNASARLDLIVQHDSKSRPEPAVYLPVINGRDRMGRDCTLFFNTRIECSVAAWLTECSYDVVYVLVGIRLREWSSAKFNEIYFNPAYLDAWINRSGLKVAWGRRGRSSITYRPPKPIKVTLPDSSILEFFPASEGPSQSIVQTESAIRQYYRIHVSSRKRLHLKNWFDKIHAIRFLLLLATGESVNMRDFELSRSDHAGKFEGRKLKRFVTLSYRGSSSSDHEFKFLPDDFIFRSKMWHQLLRGFLGPLCHFAKSTTTRLISIERPPIRLNDWKRDLLLSRSARKSSIERNSARVHKAHIELQI